MGTDNIPGEQAPIKFEIQAVNALNNLKTALKEAGSSLENLVKYYIFLKSAADAPLMWKIMLDYFQDQAPKLVEEPPAVAVSEVKAFESPGCLIAIDAIAVVSNVNPDGK